MARPKPKVLLEIVNKKTYVSEQVLEADAIYAVFYDNRPINIRTINLVKEYIGAKYKKMSFSNSGNAFALVNKLNKTFKTDKFTVVKFTVGETIKHEK